MVSNLRGIAIIAGLLGLAMVVVALLPGRLASYRGFDLFGDYENGAVWTTSAGGWVGVLHGIALLVLAFCLGRSPTVSAGWWFVVLVLVAKLIAVVINAIVWNGYAVWPTGAGHLYRGLELAELALAIVVVPLAIYLGRRASDAPSARVVT